MKPIEGKATAFYIDVKSPVRAGMQFNTNNYKIRKIGYDIVRIYLDSADKDCTVGQQRIKRVLTY